MSGEHDPSARLSCKEVFQVLEKDWKHLVRIALGGVNYDGNITALLEDGTLEFSTVVQGEGKRVMTFELAGADFERSSHPETFPLNHEPADEVFTVYPRAGTRAFPQLGGWFILLKWRYGEKPVRPSL